MRMTLLIVLSLVLSVSVTYGQEKDFARKSTEIGLNITSTLAGFFNSGGQDLPKDPYLFSLRLVRAKNIYRLGFNLRFDITDEGLNSGFREVAENKVQLRLGKEWRQPVNKRFTLYYGVDAVGSWELDKSAFSSFPDELESREETFGMGGGPFLGIIFRVHDRIFLSTEAYAYGVYYTGEKFTEFGGPLPPEDTKISRFSLQPAIPNSLYVNFRF